MAGLRLVLQHWGRPLGPLGRGQLCVTPSQAGPFASLNLSFPTCKVGDWTDPYPGIFLLLEEVLGREQALWGYRQLMGRLLWREPPSLGPDFPLLMWKPQGSVVAAI